MWRTFRLAVSAVLVVVLPQQFGQDGLMLLILFLGFFSFRTRRHVAEFQRIIPVSAGPLQNTQGGSASGKSASTFLLQSRCTAC